MSDYLLRVIAKDAGVRALATITTDLVNEAARRHETSHVATAALAEALTNGTLLGALLKIRQRVAIKYEGNGPLQKIIVESDAYGRVRGYVLRNNIDMPLLNGKPDVLRAMGTQGVLTVVKDLKLKELAEGVVMRNEDGLSDDVERYLNQSEQTPAVIEFGLQQADTGEATVAGGLLIQSLPPHNDIVLDVFRYRLQDLPSMSEMLAAGETPESILAKVFAGVEYEVLENRSVRFQCDCSRERTEKAILSIGATELRDLIETEGEAVVDCHFCKEQYYFSREDLEMLLIELEL